MSNSNDTRTAKPQAQVGPVASENRPAVAPSAAALTDTPTSKSKRWSFIQNDLEKALETWQELEQAQAKLSPEEEQFQKIKTIIGQLKSKIEQF